jgi:lysyl-tRNA synthetase class I
MDSQRLKGYSKATQQKLLFAERCLREAGITPEALVTALKRYKSKYHRMDPTAVIGYFVEPTKDLLSTVSLQFKADYEPEYPMCPSCGVNNFTIEYEGTGMKRRRFYRCKCGLEYYWDQKRKMYEAI